MVNRVLLVRLLLAVTVLLLVSCIGSTKEPESRKTGKPKIIGLEAAVKKLRSNMQSYRPSKRNLVMYHVEDIGLGDTALDVTMNNVKLFVASILHHDPNSVQSAFYLINVARSTINPATTLIPVHLPNVAIVEWEEVSSPLHSFLQMLRALDQDVISLTEAVFCLSSSVRGPLRQIQKVAWIDDFRTLLDVSGVGLVGASVSCEGVPHVETFAFAMRSVLVPQMKLEMEHYYRREENVSIDEYFAQRLTQATKESNYQIASVEHWKRNNTTVFTSKSCFASPIAEDNPLASCATPLTDKVFLHWSGGYMGSKGFSCGKGIAMNAKNRQLVQNLTESLLQLPLPTGTLPKALQIVKSEVVTGGPYAHLYAEFAEEHRRELAASASRAFVPHANEDSQVCFLVRTAKMHDPLFVSPKTGKIKYVEMDLDSFAKSLIMQTNPNWRAYFIITDPSPFERRLQEILATYNDPRLMYHTVDMIYRPDFTVVDAGYTTTDHVIKQLLDRRECKWITATNGDNAYGSEVVDRILNAQPMQNSNEQPEMLLLPMDSRNFADQDLLLRQDRPWNRKCIGLEATTAFSQLSATAGSLPKVARVDLAAIVLNRRKLRAANILFGNFSDPERFRCLGCNDGYFAQYLVRNRGWTYARQPVDGLRSLMFHGPSPTYCIAAGNVWFDHPLVNKVGCLSHETVYKILKRDAKRDKKQRYFDAKHFQESSKVCLRLNSNGFNSQHSSTVFQRRLLGDTADSNQKNEEADDVSQRQLAILPPASTTELSNDPRVFTLHHIRHERNFSQCDWKIYLRLNPDIASVKYEELPLHYERHGRSEGRLCQFDWKVYLAINKDLIGAGIDTEVKAIDHFRIAGKIEGRLYRTPEGFDWLSYLETNTDLYPALKTKADALNHYRCCGIPEMRPIAAALPRQHTLDAAMRKLDAFLNSVTHKPGKRNLVIYHIEDIGSSDNALELTQNNVKVFVAAVLHHAAAAAAAKTADQQEAFYWFNVAGLMDNPVYNLLPTHLPNVAALSWIYASSSFNSFFQTIKNFDAPMLERFDAVFVSSSGVRGPLVHFENGAWLGEFRKLLDVDQVGLVGPIVRCEPSPHVLNHMFAVRSGLLPTILAEYTDYDEFVPIEEYFLERLSSVVFEAGYKIASLLHASRNQVAIVSKEQCVDPFPPSDDLDASCSVQPSEVLFIRWSGEPWGAKRFICNKGIAMNEHNMRLVEDLTRRMIAAPLLTGLTLPATLTPNLPEAPTGWFIYEEFNKESAVMQQPAIAAQGKESSGSQVCFLVNVDQAHDLTARPVADVYERTYLQNLIQSLLVQTNPNWKAFFYTSDPVYAPQLRSTIDSVQDSRLVLLSIVATSTVRWNEILQKHQECQWVSATSGNVVYGSEIVSRVLQTSNKEKADMLLAPMDSAVFAQQDFQWRGEVGRKWRCVGLEAMISLYQMSYTAQPLPQYGRVFAPSIFYRSTKLIQESVLPGNLTMPSELSCPGCEEGLHAQYLVRSRGWSYARLAMDGLRSTVFDGSSPTHCIASGNVWLDHTCPQKAGCVSHKTIRQLQLADSKKAKQGLYDWEHFNSRDQICLRLSQEGTKADKCS